MDRRDAAARGPARRAAHPPPGSVTLVPPVVHPGAAPADVAAAVAVLPVAVRQRTEPGHAAARQESVAAGSLTDRSTAGGVRATGTPAGIPVRAHASAASAAGRASVQAAAPLTGAGSGDAAAASAAADLAALADALLAAGRGDAVPNAVPADPVVGAAAGFPAPIRGAAQSRLTRPSAPPDPPSSMLLDIERGFSLLDRLTRDASAPGPGTIGGGLGEPRALRPMEGGATMPVLDDRTAAAQYGSAAGAASVRSVLLDTFGRADVPADAGPAVDAVGHALAAQLARHGVDPT
jgi:hypothetical protein